MAQVKGISRKDNLTDEIFEKYCLNCDKTPWCIAFNGYCIDVKKVIEEGEK